MTPTLARMFALRERSFKNLPSGSRYPSYFATNASRKGAFASISSSTPMFSVSLMLRPTQS
jgi:hypothetical protein